MTAKVEITFGNGTDQYTFTTSSFLTDGNAMATTNGGKTTDSTLLYTVVATDSSITKCDVSLAETPVKNNSFDMCSGLTYEFKSDGVTSTLTSTFDTAFSETLDLTDGSIKAPTLTCPGASDKVAVWNPCTAGVALYTDWAVEAAAWGIKASNAFLGAELHCPAAVATGAAGIADLAARFMHGSASAGASLMLNALAWLLAMPAPITICLSAAEIGELGLAEAVGGVNIAIFATTSILLAAFGVYEFVLALPANSGYSGMQSYVEMAEGLGRAALAGFEAAGYLTML